MGELLDTDVLVGMDIINKGDFAVSNRNGATSFSFRIPSVENFDFAAEDEHYGFKRRPLETATMSLGRIMFSVPSMPAVNVYETSVVKKCP